MSFSMSSLSETMDQIFTDYQADLKENKLVDSRAKWMAYGKKLNNSLRSKKKTKPNGDT